MRQADTFYDNKQYNEAFPLYKQAAELVIRMRKVIRREASRCINKLPNRVMPMVKSG